MGKVPHSLCHLPLMMKGCILWEYNRPGHREREGRCPGAGMRKRKSSEPMPEGGTVRGLGRMHRRAAGDWMVVPAVPLSDPVSLLPGGGWEEAVTQGGWASWPEPKGGGPWWPCDSGSRAGCQGRPWLRLQARLVG